MKTPRFFRAALAGACLLFMAPAASAQNAAFDNYLDSVAAKARAEGVSQGTIDRIFNGLQPSSRVLELDRDNMPSGSSSSSNSFPSMSAEMARYNTDARISGGKRNYQRLYSVAQQISQQYGVPAPILFGIWGHETSYGAVMGNFDLAQALATLAWEGRRRALFEPELIALLKIADRENLPRSRMQGSWAGAFGNPQFLPSIYLRLAVDGNGDGRTDIWGSEVDTLHSIANYFRDAGWRTGQPWAVRAYVPNTFNDSGIENTVHSPVCPRVHDRHSKWMTVREWRERGVIPQGAIGDDVMAALFEPDGRSAPGYLLTQNYRVILEYNCSNYYAFKVGLLADEIAR